MSSWCVSVFVRMKVALGAEVLNRDFVNAGSGFSCVLAFLLLLIFHIKGGDSNAVPPCRIILQLSQRS